MTIRIKDKIAVITDCNPLESTVQQRLADELSRRLLEEGYDSYVVKVPVDWSNGDTLMQSILSLRLLKVMNADAVVAIDFPAAIIQHHNKYAWFTDTIANVAKQRFASALTDALQAKQEEAYTMPHRLTVLQDLLEKMDNSYQSEITRSIYCENAFTNAGEAEEPQDQAIFSGLTNVLKNALKKMKASDDDEKKNPRLQSLLVPAFESTDEYLKKLPWDSITQYYTRTMEIE